MDNQTTATRVVGPATTRYYDRNGEISRETLELVEISRKLDRIIELLGHQRGMELVSNLVADRNQMVDRK